MLFKKLNEEIQKSDVKQEVINLSEKDRRAIEQDIIFGNVLEELEVDILEAALEEKTNKPMTSGEAEARRLNREKGTEVFTTDQRVAAKTARKGEEVEPPQKQE